MRVAILDCCCPNPPELAGFGAVGDILADWLRPHAGDADFVRVDVWGGEPPPAPGDCDAFIVSGSEAGVYDDTPWMEGLRAALLALREAGKPMLGVCFGHQIMADTFGGRAQKAESGYAAGVARFEWGGDEFDAFVLHGDQVTAIPPGALVTCAAPHCPVAGLAYDFPALSVQFHPEYARDYVDRVADMLAGDLLTPAQAQAAQASTARFPVRAGLLAADAMRFLRSGASGREFVAGMRLA